MRKKSNFPKHIGRFIRDNVIPSGMSVTDAAKRMGVSRPTLSNLLNGKAPQSPAMAIRLETTFGADAQELLRLQVAFQIGDHKTVAARPNGAETKAAGWKVMVNVTGADRPTETKVTVTDAFLGVIVATHPNGAETKAGRILRILRYIPSIIGWAIVRWLLSRLST